MFTSSSTEYNVSTQRSLLKISSRSVRGSSSALDSVLDTRTGDCDVLTMKDWTGTKFGRWNILSEVSPIYYAGHKYRRWLCKCDCGTIRIKSDHDFKSHKSTSCGCRRIEVVRDIRTTHGHKRNRNPTGEYKSWAGMIQRCTNPRMRQFKDYGGRGIIVCDEWRYSFELFFADMGNKPTPQHSLDRYPNMNGNYEPGNCRWATRQEQNRNTRQNHWLEGHGKKMLISDWGHELRVTNGMILKSPERFGLTSLKDEIA